MARPTLKDVAARAGVSVSTVSYALNERSTLPLAEQTKARIRRIATEIGYVPNGVARSLQARSSRSIGVLLNKPLTTPRYASIAQGIAGGLGARGYHPAFLDGVAAQRCVEDARGGRLDGLVFIGHDDHEVPEELEHAVLGYGLPFVALDCGAPRPYPTVDFDYGAGVDDVMAELERRGVREVLFLRPDLGTRAEREREQAVMRAMAERPSMTLRTLLNGITLERMRTIDTTAAAYLPQLLALVEPILRELGEEQPKTAVLCAWGADVEAVYRTAQQLGSGITVASLAAGALAPSLWPALVQSRLPLEAAGEACAQLIVEAIAGDSPTEPILLRPVLETD